MISPVRLAHVLVSPEGRRPVVAWVEGGRKPILLAPAADLGDTGEWAITQGAVGVLVRRQCEPDVYWWGPGDVIPFNKADVHPLVDLSDEPSDPLSEGFAGAMSAEVDDEGYVAYWADRAWWSLNPGSRQRRRRLFDSELHEISEKGQIDCAGDAEQVLVNRVDMFLEGRPHLRGMIRTRHVEGLNVVTDAEDAVHPNFHAGPPLQIYVEPPL